MTSLSQSLATRVLVELGNTKYLIRDRVEFAIPNLPAISANTVSPAVVINVGSSNVSAGFIESKFRSFNASDDVFNDHFTRDGYVILQRPSKSEVEENTHDELRRFLDDRSDQLLYIDSTLPEGPYFLKGRDLHQAWRLYHDTLSAFTVSVLPIDDANPERSPKIEPRYQPFDAAPFTDAVSFVPVPSRLYFNKSRDYPLAGVRFTIKDNMHLSGTVTGLGNKAFAQLYGQQDTTSEYVNSLIQKGAIIVGKTKLSAFAGSEVPPNQCIDYFPPWNPRGDGYQGPSGSSSGAGASIAGYPWVDVSLCTDTGGSLRHPASSHGAWGLRVSWNTLSMKDVVPATPLYDSFGFLSRIPSRLKDLLDLSGFDTALPRPSKLVYPTDWYPMANENQQKMNELFLEVLEDYLGIKHTKISLKEEWWRTGPEDIRGITLDEYLGKSGNIVGAYHVYHTFDDFRREYPAKYGKQPYVSPAHAARWQNASTISEEDYNRSLETTKVFKMWFESTFWNSNEAQGPTIFIVPQGRPGANYRDVVGIPATGGFGGSYNPITITCILGCPHLVVPIGQNPYESRVTGNVEYAPIFSSIIGPPKSDALLVEVASSALEKAGWPTTVLTGQFMFAKGDNERNTKSVARESVKVRVD